MSDQSNKPSNSGLDRMLRKRFKDFALYAKMGLDSKLPYPSTVNDYEKALSGVVEEAKTAIEALILEARIDELKKACLDNWQKSIPEQYVLNRIKEIKSRLGG